MSNRPPLVRVQIVDRSPVVARQLTKDLSADHSIEVVSASGHVVLIDVNGPDALAAISAASRKQAVVAAVPATPAGGRLAVDALTAGAIEVVARPYSSADASVLAKTLRGVAAHRQTATGHAQSASCSISDSLLAITAGPGGTRSLATALRSLPAGATGLLIVPLPAFAVGPWLERIRPTLAATIIPAVDGDTVTPGRIHAVTTDSHLMLKGCRVMSVRPGPAVFGRRPSAELLFESVANHAPDSVGVLLGGYGYDGIAGLMHLRTVGGRTITESDSTASLTELSARARDCGAAEWSVPADQVVTAVGRLTEHRNAPLAA